MRRWRARNRSPPRQAAPQAPPEFLAGAGRARRRRGHLRARRAGLAQRSRHIARVNVTGIITENRKLTEAVAALADDRSVPAVIVSIDSPGGSVAGGESLHAALDRVAAAKPVVAVMRGTAASAGYMVSLPAERIFAREATLTGSIGVILQTAEFVRPARQARHRSAGDHLRPAERPAQLHPPAHAGGPRLPRRARAGHVRPVRDHGRQRRGTWTRTPSASSPTGAPIPGGRRSALGLVDEIGGEIEARAWLASQHGIRREHPGARPRDGRLLRPHLRRGAARAAHLAARRWHPAPGRSGPEAERFLDASPAAPASSRPPANSHLQLRHDKIRADRRSGERQSSPDEPGRGADRGHDLRRDHRGAGPRRPRRVARLRRVHRQAARRPHRPQPAHRRGRAGEREARAVLQGRQGAARARQPRPASPARPRSGPSAPRPDPCASCSRSR